MPESNKIDGKDLILSGFEEYGDDAIQFYQFMSDLEAFYLNGGKRLHYSIAPNAKLGDIIRSINKVNKEWRENRGTPIDFNELDGNLPTQTVDEFLAPKENCPEKS